MDRLTRKELKTDKFALEVEHGFEYVSEHKRQVIRYGSITGGIVIVALAAYGFLAYRASVRNDALRAALQIEEAVVGSPGDEARQGFATPQLKEAAFKKAMNDVAEKYSGSEQGAVARYYLGIVAANNSELANAEQQFRQVIDHGSKDYASLAKLSLAPVLQAENKAAEGEQMLRSLVEHPTAFVSKDMATIALARYLGPNNPAEARKLLEPLRTERSTVSRMALAALAELTPSN